MEQYSIASFVDASVHALIRTAELLAEHYRAAIDIAMVAQAAVVQEAETVVELATEVVEEHGHAPKHRYRSHHLAERKQQAPFAMGPYV